MQLVKRKKSQQELSVVLENLSEGILVLDRMGRIREMNQVFSDIFHVDRKKAIGKPFVAVLRHVQLEALRQKAIEQGKPIVEEVTFLIPEERTLEARWIPLKKGREVTGTALITWMGKLSKSKQDFLANVSHEFRTPLSAIKGGAETLMLGAVDDRSHRMEFLENIVKNADRLDRMVSNILNFSSPAANKNGPVKQRVDVDRLLVEIVDAVQTLASEKQISVSIKGGVTSRVVNTDHHYLSRILTDLLVNAIMYNKADGWVTVRVERQDQGKALKFLIEDGGIGIQHVDAKHIFERFYRGDQNRNEPTDGSGLGLAIAKNLTEALGGKIGFRSRAGHGSTFWVTLPAA